MDVRDLTRNQLVELKQRYLIDWYDTIGQSPSYGELADADDIVSDDTIFYYYDGINFVEDDLWTK